MPGDHSTNNVGVLCRPELADFVGGGGSPRLVSDANLPILVRQIALHADVSIHWTLHLKMWKKYSTFGLNWVWDAFLVPYNLLSLVNIFPRNNKHVCIWRLWILRYIGICIFDPFQLASTIWESLNRPPHSPYASNWLERLRKIRKIKQMVTDTEGAPPSNLMDFTDMVDADKWEKSRAGSSGYWQQFLAWMLWNALCGGSCLESVSFYQFIGSKGFLFTLFLLLINAIQDWAFSQLEYNCIGLE